MKAPIKNQIQTVVFATIIGIVFSCSSVFGDDLNPPSYRGSPLSVSAEWQLLAGTTSLSLTNYNSVDDSDPSTYLYPIQPTVFMDPAVGNYDFRLPNFVDELPIKYLRLQLTWTGTTQPPISLLSNGWDGTNLIPGVVTFVSSPLVFTQPDGGYQYFDIEFRPNPDYELVSVHLPPDGLLTQVVIDTVSTVPEPVTLGLMALGGMGIIRRKK